MRRFPVNIITLIGIIAIIAGCNKDPIEDNPPINPTNVTPEWNVDIWETLQPNSRLLNFDISSILQNHCEYTSVDYTLSFDGQEIAISIKGVNEVNCNDGMEDQAAQSRITVSNQSIETGFYDITIDLAGVVMNKGEMTVAFDKYILDLNSLHGLKLLHKEVLRVPNDVIWGYVGYDDLDLENAAQDFISAMNALEPGSYQPGYYGYFTIDPTGKNITINEQIPHLKWKTFTFQNVQESNLFLNTLEDFEEEYMDELHIKIYTSRGDVF